MLQHTRDNVQLLFHILILSDVARFNLGSEGEGDNDKVISWGSRLKRRPFFQRSPQSFNFSDWMRGVVRPWQLTKNILITENLNPQFELEHLK